MNVDTGELRRFSKSLTQEEMAEHRNRQSKNMIKGFVPVPKDLEKEANLILEEREKAFVDMKQDTPLVRWAISVKQGRNNKCACGSGKKYKYCCLNKAKEAEGNGKTDD